jgi:hypothetical protein
MLSLKFHLNYLQVSLNQAAAAVAVVVVATL